MRRLTVLDLFCGLGGFSAAFKDRGHLVIGIDIVPPATVLADAARLPFRISFRPDVLLASPPCTEFSRESMPWSKTGKAPSTSLFEATWKAIATYQPAFWAVENVRGALPWISKRPTIKLGSRYFWTNIPLLHASGNLHGKWRLPPTPDRARLRSLIPREISDRICQICEACA